MCLIVAAVGVSRRYPLILAANRDEHHERPTQAAAWWADAPHLLAGRDLLAGGTWLAVDRRGRVAAVTNIREAERRPGLRSRGSLVVGYFTGADSAGRYAARVVAEGGEFAPFNLLLIEDGSVHHASNRAGAAELGAGLHAFSNAPPGVEWPKVDTARAGIERLLDHDAPLEPLFTLLAERGAAATRETRYRAAHFIIGPEYGTRCSTVVLANENGELLFAERSFDAAGKPIREVRETFAVAAR
jgi:uncharacterized protein with NRDE domain